MSDPITAYPLCWPQGWKRSTPAQRKRAHFSKTTLRQSSVNPQKERRSKHSITVSEAVSRLLMELLRLGIAERGDVIASTNIRVKLDGLPYSNQAEPDDPGVAVYWRMADEKETKCMAIDRYDRVADNLAAVAATIAALRAIERPRGVTYRPRHLISTVASTPRGEILGFPERVDLPRAEAAFRDLAKRHHPDSGGDSGQFAAICEAIKEARSL